MRVFVTGASGWIGSAVAPELLSAGHAVVGLARSDASAGALVGAGATVLRASLDDLDAVAQGAAGSDGVIHLAFKHDVAFSGDYLGAARADRRVVEAIADALSGSGRPFVVAAGTAGVALGRVATERDGHAAGVHELQLEEGPAFRHGTTELVLGLAERGIRSSVVRLPPTCHGKGDNGLIAALVNLARANGFSGYVGDGSNRWPAVHRLDAASMFVLALEMADAGSTLHAVAEEGVAIRDVAEVIGRHLGLPARSVARDDVADRFGFLARFVGIDTPASSRVTRELLGWEPSHAGLVEDLEQGHYFVSVPR